MTLPEIVMSCLGGLLSIVMMILGWVGNRAIDKLEKTSESVAVLASRTSVLESAATTKRLDDHEAQLRLIDGRLGEILGRLEFVRAILEQRDRNSHQEDRT